MSPAILTNFSSISKSDIDLTNVRASLPQERYSLGRLFNHHKLLNIERTNAILADTGGNENCLVYYDKFMKGALIMQTWEDVLKLEGLIVKEKFRRRGIAQALMECALENKSYNFVCAQAHWQNSESRALLEKLDFKIKVEPTWSNMFYTYERQRKF